MDIPDATQERYCSLALDTTCLAVSPPARWCGGRARARERDSDMTHDGIRASIVTVMVVVVMW